MYNNRNVRSSILMKNFFCKVDSSWYQSKSVNTRKIWTHNFVNFLLKNNSVVKISTYSNTGYTRDYLELNNVSGIHVILGIWTVNKTGLGAKSIWKYATQEAVLEKFSDFSVDWKSEQ